MSNPYPLHPFGDLSQNILGRITPKPLPSQLQEIAALDKLHPTILQSKALGYQVGDKVTGRLIAPPELNLYPLEWHGKLTETNLEITTMKWDKTDELKDDGSYKKILVDSYTYKDGLAWLHQQNTKGYQVFYHVNGGRTKTTVSKTYAAFFESDEGSFDQQWAIIKNFEQQTGITPSVVVKTRKSLHVYFALEASDQNIEGWTEELQRPLALAMKSDPAIQNLDRLMRLAGFNHCKVIDGKLDFVPCTLEICNSKQYFKQQIVDAIATVSPQPYSDLRFKFWQYLQSSAHKDLGLNIDPEIAINCPEDELEELDLRWRRYIKLTRDKQNGKLVNPEDAFSPQIKPQKRKHPNPSIFDGSSCLGDSNTFIWAKYLYGYNPHGRGDWITAQDPIIPDSDRHLHSIDSLHINRITGAFYSHRGTDSQDVYDAMRERAETEIWHRLASLTYQADIAVNVPLLNLEDIVTEKKTIYIVKSPKGTGKTNALIPLIPKYKNVFAMFNRIALGREECERIGLSWQGTRKTGFCANSSYQYPDSWLIENGLLIVDECDQVFDHIFGSTCNKNGSRPRILSQLKSFLECALNDGNALFMSADITDRDVEYIRQIAPANCNIKIVQNEYRPPLGTINLFASEKPDLLIADLIKRLQKGENIFLIDDKKDGCNGCKSIAHYLIKYGFINADKVVEINGDTSGNPAIIKYLTHINESSLNTQLLVCSPSVVSGLSLQNGHFTSVYGVSNGVLTCSQFSQALARVRGCKNINIWVAEYSFMRVGDGSKFPEQIKSHLKRNYDKNSQLLASLETNYLRLETEFQCPHLDLYAKNAAYRNLCSSDLRRRMIETLEAEGYTVIVGQGETEGADGVSDGLKLSDRELEITRANNIANAKILSDDELDKFENPLIKPTAIDQLNITKTFLNKSFGDDLIGHYRYQFATGNKETLSGYAAISIANKHGALKRQLELYRMLVSDPSVAIAADLEAEKRQLEHGDRLAFDIKWNASKVKCLKFLGIDKFLDPNLLFKPGDYAELAAKCRKYSKRIKDVLGLEVRRVSDGQVFASLMNLIGLKLDTQRSGKAGRPRLRRINPDAWATASAYLNFKCVSVEAIATSTISLSVSPESVHPSIDIYSNSIGGDGRHQPQLEYGVEAIAATQNFEALEEASAPGFDGIETDINEVAEAPETVHPPIDIYSNSIGGGGRHQPQLEYGVEAIAATQNFEALEEVAKTVVEPSEEATPEQKIKRLSVGDRCWLWLCDRWQQAYVEAHWGSGFRAMLLEGIHARLVTPRNFDELIWVD